VPVMYPLYLPPSIVVRPEERQFWRVLNASADTYFNLQVRFGSTIQDVNTPRPVDLIAMDGVAIGGPSQRTEILLSPGARAEFIMTTPPAGTWAQLITLPYDTGPDGSATPRRTIANLVSKADAKSPPVMPPAGEGARSTFAGLTGTRPVRRRTLYFSEDRTDLKSPKYYLTEEGAAPKVFDMRFKIPDITVRHGTTEDWVIENRAQEAHSFHIHQLKFQLLERDGEKIDEPMLRDTIDVPYWDGKSTKYPSVTLRMDFRNPQIVGTFVYHCHILEHEDGGMMGSIQVK
jgi:FtsP/CotA-like multicopper oxidase with cupredoxin domain